jgi:hypothetical protein
METKLVIKPHRPVWRVLAWSAVVSGVTLVVAVALDVGHWRYSLGMTAANSYLSENHALKDENEDLYVAIQRLERGREIEEQERRELQQVIQGLRTEISELHQEIDFYRGVVAAADDQAAGPRVEGLRLAAFDENGRYSYRVVLTHVSKEDRYVEGSLEIRVEGNASGAPASLDLRDLAEAGADQLSYKFKHFRRLEGIIRLPEGFTAEQVHVALLDKGSRRPVFDATYNWVDLVN